MQPLTIPTFETYSLEGSSAFVGLLGEVKLLGRDTWCTLTGNTLLLFMKSSTSRSLACVALFM